MIDNAQSGMNVTCGKCGHTADIDQWTRTEIAGRLPIGHFQCPSCHFAFRKCETTPGQTFRAGGSSMYIPGKIELVPCQPVM